MNLIKKNLFFLGNSFRFIEKFQRQYRESLNTECPVFPIINTLCLCGVYIIINQDNAIMNCIV